MRKRSTWLSVAISVTTLDGAVTTYYGGLVWKAFAVVIWSRLLFLLLGAVWATTLIHIWAYACSQIRNPDREFREVTSISANDLSAGMTGEIDV